MTHILVMGDTHCRTWEEVHPNIRKLVPEADIVVHCGDLTNIAIAEGLKKEAQQAIVVHGNSDSPDITAALPKQEVLKIQGKTIAITHPYWGGPPFDPAIILNDFDEQIDIVLSGHTHDPMNEERDGVLYINPGQAYRSFLTDATVAFLDIDDGKVSSQIHVIENWRDRYPGNRKT